MESVRSDERSWPHAQIVVCLDYAAGRQRVVEAGRDFFRLGWEMLGVDLHDTVAAALEQKAYLGDARKRGVAGGISTRCDFGTLDAVTGRVLERSFTYSPRKFERMVADFTPETVFASFAADTWVARDNGLYRVARGDPSLHLTWLRLAEPDEFDPVPDWVRLYAEAPAESLLGSPHRQEAAVEFLRQVLDRANPAWAEISYSPPLVPFTTPLNYLLRRDDSAALRESRFVLQGYSWVTVISEEVGQRLGGVDGLVASGAFHRVEHLTGGGYLLQATERFEDYQHAQAYQVFRTLASALPRGVPQAPRSYPVHGVDDPDFMIIQLDPSAVLDTNHCGTAQQACEEHRR